jgi:hypothetical protein
MRKRKQTNNILFITSILILLITAGCSSQDLFEINKEGTFSSSQCSAHNPNYEVIMFESKYCSHCQETLPVFKEAALARGITPVILDLAEAEQRTRMQEEYNIIVQYTPTFLFGCDYVTGAKTLEEYNQLFDTYEEYRDVYT